jgi:hypothetical protein
MTRAVLILRNQADRDKAAAWCRNAPPGTRVEFKQVKRSLPQNDRMWAMLTDVSRQAKLHGLTLTPDDWKLVFLDALKREARFVPNLDGDGFVNIGRSSSDLSKQEMTDLIEIIFAYGAKHGVVFQDEADAA